MIKFFNTFAKNRKPVRLIRHLSEMREDHSNVLLIKSISSFPSKVIPFIENGWRNGNLPVNDVVMREYIKAVVKLDKLDSLKVMELANYMNKSQSSNQDPNLPKSTPLTPGSQFLSTSFPGSSPSEPLYMTQIPLSFRSQAWRAARTFIVMFLVLAYVSAVLDDRTGGGGLSARLGIATVIHQAEESDKTFDDVVGIDEAKSELQEIVLYLKNPSMFTRLGGKLPKGVLLTGPPGTGKTLLAKAIAGEAGVPFFYTSGSEFEEMYVGVGARRVRDLFDVAKSKSPCIIFIDEIDAVGGSRHLKEQSAMKMTLNQLLVEMDGFEQNKGVIVIGATNFADALDSALTRPGRFDKHIEVPMPDVGGRKQILELYGRKIPLAPDVDLETLARGTPGFSGADLSNLVNQAAIKASIDGLKLVGMQALEYAKDKIMMGSERKSAVISPETMRMTAYHEAGHALVALKTDGADPVHKATIMPRGRALGMVMQLPDGDQTSMSRKQMLARLDVCMGGRAAEELIFGPENVTSGASSDIQQATRLAKAMVTKYGLGEKVGIMFFDDKEKLGEESQEEIDKEVRQLLRDSYSRAKTLIESNSAQLDRIAQGLLEFESLSGIEVVDVMNGKKINAKIRSQRPSREIKQSLPLNPSAKPQKNS